MTVNERRARPMTFNLATLLESSAEKFPDRMHSSWVAPV
jgi:hypothetical protein